MRWRSVGAAGGCAPSSAARTRSNSQGSPSAARPIITPSQPVSCSSASAPAALVTSPLAKTGISTACLMAAMAPASMGGMYICSRVRPCTASRSAPLPAHCLATSTPVRCSSSQPMRILTVSGVSPPRALRAAATIAPHSGGSSSRRLPAPLEVILGAGQPMLMSNISKRMPFSRTSKMALASVSGSAPNSWMAYSPWGAGSLSSAKDLRSPKQSALALAISLTVHAAPWSAIRWRQAASVSPAMGANTAPVGICRVLSCMGYLFCVISASILPHLRRLWYTILAAKKGGARAAVSRAPALPFP